MLISFSVQNFRSFGEEMTLNMVASNKLAEHPHHLVTIPETGKSVLRSAVVYGANAAGKSNLVKAISQARNLILERSGRISPVNSFYFDPRFAGQPTSFEFRILIEDSVFTYGFDILRDRFTSEWLTILNGSEELSIFERDKDGHTRVDSATQRLLPKEQTIDTLRHLSSVPIRNDQLFLNRAIGVPQPVQGKTLGAIIRWFTDELLVLNADSRDCKIIDRLHSDPTFRNFCSQFLSNVGTGVGTLNVTETTREAIGWEQNYLHHPDVFESGMLFGCDGDTDLRLCTNEPGKVTERKLVAQHVLRDKAYALPFSDESDGTRSLLHLMPVLSPTAHSSRVVVIDELDRSLHPLLCSEFIKFYSESCPGSRRQLIVTTHEVQLLDQELLRRDEYWFVEKDKKQQTQLYSLSEFNIRNDLKVRKGYLAGRFGAIPVIGGMQQLEGLLQCKEAEEAPNAAQNSAT